MTLFKRFLFSITAVTILIVASGSLSTLAADTWQFKAPAPNAAKIRPYLDAVTSLRSEMDKDEKNIPADAAARLAKIKSLSASFQQEGQALASGLKQTGETAAYDEWIAARLQKSGHSTAAGEIKRQGGASAMLANTPKLVAEDLEDLSSRINAAGKPGALANIIVGGILDLLETQNAEALYGGGVKGNCNWYTILYYASIGVEPTFCIYR